MSADLLREAAVAIRTDANRETILREGDNYWATEASLFEQRFTPAVALAVADWLDREATLHDSMNAMGDLLNVAAKELGAGEIRLAFSDPGDQMAASTMPQALAVARAYLGRDA